MSGLVDRYQIWLMRWDGSSQELLSADAPNNLWPSWTPDGQKITFTQIEQSGVGRIHIMDMVSRVPQLLVKDNSASQDWSSDGSLMAFACWLTDVPKIWIMDANGVLQGQLTSGALYDSQPVWFP